MSDALDPFSYYVPASAMAAYKAQQAAGAASPGIVFARRGGYPVRRRRRCPARRPRRPASSRATSSTRSTASRCATRRSGRSRPRSRGPKALRASSSLFRGGDEKRVTLPVAARPLRAAARSSTKWERDVAIIKIPTLHAGDRGRACARSSRRRRGARSTRSSLDLRGSIGGAIAGRGAASRRSSSAKGPIATRASRARRPSKPLEATGEPVWKGKVVLLIDDSTAGAAEVFAAALHDRAEATTVGETHGRHGDHPAAACRPRRAAAST